MENNWNAAQGALFHITTYLNFDIQNGWTAAQARADPEAEDSDFKTGSRAWRAVRRLRNKYSTIAEQVTRNVIHFVTAQTLSLHISGTARTVGTASGKGSVTVLGRVRPFRIYLEGMPNPFYIHPYVVRDLAHCVNMGQAFFAKK